MTPQEIKRLIRNEIDSAANRGQFNVQNLPYHIHNGIDAPPVFNPTRIYTGFVPSTGDISGASSDGFVFMPQGWTVEVEPGLIYKITHNLNTEFYSVCAMQTGQASQNIFPATICQGNFFEISWFTTGFVSKAQDFHFVLTQTNNKTQQFPNYTTNPGI